MFAERILRLVKARTTGILHLALLRRIEPGSIFCHYNSLAKPVIYENHKRYVHLLASYLEYEKM